MSLYGLLEKRRAINRPVRIGVIGAGTFSSAFLNQGRRVAGMQVVSVADLDAEKAKRGEGRFSEEYVFSIMDSLVSLEMLHKMVEIEKQKEEVTITLDNVCIIKS